MSFKETELGKIPEKWDLVRLEDIADVLDPHPSHRAPNEVENGFPFAGIGDINEYGEINIEKARKVSENIILNHIENYFIDKNSIGYGRVGTVGKVVKLKERSKYKYALSPTLAVINGNDKVDNDYLYALLRSKIFFNQVKKFMTGSTRPSIGIKALRDIMVPYPSKNEQILIGKIISTLDEKIEVNNKINKTLENIAQTIFKQWFVDFEFPNGAGEPYKSSGGEMVESELGMIPKGWEVTYLRKIIDIVKQGTKPGEYLKSRKYNPIDTLPMKTIAMNDYKSYEEAKSSLILFEKYDILVGAMRVYFHRVNLAPYKGITRTTTFVLRSKRKEDMPYNLFLINMNETIEYAEKTSKGSTMPYAVWENGMGNFVIAHPSKALRDRFFEIIQPLLDSIINRSNENKALMALRDSLLPKLMSGEIRVPIEEN